MPASLFSSFHLSPSSFPAIVLFHAEHLATLAVIIACCVAFAMAGRVRGGAFARPAAFALAALLVLNKIAVYWTILSMEEFHWTSALPMHMCDWSAIAAIIALIWRRQLAFEMAYFWGLGGTLQATLTPDLAYDFPDIRFITFFASHGGTLVAIAFLVFGLRMRPWPVSLIRIFIWSNIYLVAAGTVDFLLDENYGYLRAKPFHASLLDHLGPWPWYILSLEAVAILSYLIYYSPFFVADSLRKKASSSPEPPEV